MMLATAAWKNAVRVRSSQPLAASCGNRRIGSEPPDPQWDSSGHWQRVMQGHAGANLMPVVAANRFGLEVGHGSPVVGSREITFYGSSFISDPYGRVLIEASRDRPTVLVADLDLAQRAEALTFGLLYTRRPDRYRRLLTSSDLGRPAAAESAPVDPAAANRP